MIWMTIDSAHGAIAAEPATLKLHEECTWALAGQRLAEQLRATRKPFLRTLERGQLSKDYLRQSRFIIDEYATFCDGEGTDAANPWLLRQRYLAHRAELRSHHRYSASYLDNHTRELRHFLRWYQRQVVLGCLSRGELTAELLQAYWSIQQGALPYRRRILSAHLASLLPWLQQRPVGWPDGELEPRLGGYFEERRLAMRGKGYGFVLTHRAGIVTRRHLLWLEQQGHLPAGSAAQGVLSTGATTVSGDGNRPATKHAKNDAGVLLDHFAARVDRDLPQSLRQPLIEYLGHLIHDRELVKKSLESILRTNLALCRTLAAAGCDSFAPLRVRHVDQTVASLIRAPQHDLLRRRRQVQARNSQLRGFLRYLHRRGLLDRDLAAVLISPPCYRASRPPTVISPQHLRRLLEAVDRQIPWGRRCYAILVLLTTYGLRPVDVSQLRLDDLHWRAQQIALVQKKTGRMLVLPLLPEVAVALYDYLRHDRLPGLVDRHVFVSLDWPHRPVCARTICDTVHRAMQDARLPWGRAKHLRASVATHLLRQGEAFSTIQEVLGHRTAETTQRYAVCDLELMRQVIEETER